MKLKTKKILKILSAFVVFCMLFSFSIGAEPVETPESIDPDPLKLDCKSAILIEANTGTVLYEKNADEPLPPASVTKVMTLLLVMEAIESGKIGYEDMVRASANACSMGGSQIYLRENEEMSVEDLLKSVVIASANDAAVALAEHISGSEELFVEQMNAKAAKLAMENTHFENTNGLDDTVTNHVTSARDIAIMSRELIKYPKIIEYSSKWMDSIREGSFGLTNTNRLVRFYKGATGLKTGSTSKAGFCISATAKRDGMTLICVIMGAPSRDVRTSAAASLLDYGFANYGIYSSNGETIETIRVLKGTRPSIKASYDDYRCVMSKSDQAAVQKIIELPKAVNAPIKKGDVIGSVVYKIGDKTLARKDILAQEDVPKLDVFSAFMLLLQKCAQIL